MRRSQSCLAVAAVVTWAGLAHAESGDCSSLPHGPLSLAAAEERFSFCNREVRAAELAAAAAAADRRIAAQRLNPTMTLGANNLNPHAGVGAGSLRDKTFDSSIRFEQVIERGGKTELREAQALELYAAARADVAEQRRLQRLAMRTAYFDLAAAQEKVRLQEDFRALAAESASAATRRFEAGEVPRVEANRFRLEAARTTNDALQAEAERDRARLELAKLLGAESSARALVVEVQWPDGEPALRMNGARPDVVAARHRVMAAQAGRELARRIATRDVTVGVQADRWPVSETNTQGTGISYGVTLQIPLHVRHANEGEAARANADFETAQAAVVKAESVAEAEARLTEADWLAARQRRMRVESEVRPMARDVGAAAEFAYAKGATSVFELLEARRSLKAVELDEVQARADAAKAWARREAAVETTSEE